MTPRVRTLELKISDNPNPQILTYINKILLNEK